MARYIDAEKLFEEIESLYVFLGGDNVFNKTAKESVLQKIDEQPTADVVEVVRCKDCKWFSVHNKDGCYRPDLDHHAQMTPVYEDDFCSYGTPKERGEEK